MIDLSTPPTARSWFGDSPTLRESAKLREVPGGTSRNRCTRWRTSWVANCSSSWWPPAARAARPDRPPVSTQKDCVDQKGKLKTCKKSARILLQGLPRSNTVIHSPTHNLILSPTSHPHLYHSLFGGLSENSPLSSGPRLDRSTSALFERETGSPHARIRETCWSPRRTKALARLRSHPAARRNGRPTCGQWVKGCARQ